LCNFKRRKIMKKEKEEKYFKFEGKI